MHERASSLYVDRGLTTAGKFASSFMDDMMWMANSKQATLYWRISLEHNVAERDFSSVYGLLRQFLCCAAIHRRLKWTATIKSLNAVHGNPFSAHSWSTQNAECHSSAIAIRPPHIVSARKNPRQKKFLAFATLNSGFAPQRDSASSWAVRDIYHRSKSFRARLNCFTVALLANNFNSIKRKRCNEEVELGREGRSLIKYKSSITLSFFSSFYCCCIRPSETLKCNLSALHATPHIN